MSNAPAEQRNQEASFWDFVACSKCFLPFTSNSSLTVPFWLTECGHIICNNHLNPDQSCAACRATDVQVVPLQTQLDEPMSNWFCAIPDALNTIAFAAKFQHEMMANQIRFYRSRCQQYRSYMEKHKHDVADLRKANEALAKENESLRQQLGGGNPGHFDDPADYTNANGKRPMIHSNGYFQTDQRSSSPRSIPTPIAPHRLTLPPGQQPPELSSSRQGAHPRGVVQRPPSNRRVIQQYAYAPPDTPQLRPPQLSRRQVAPQQFQRAPANENNSDPGPPPSRSLSRQAMPPPQLPPSRQTAGQQQQQRPRVAETLNRVAAAGPSRPAQTTSSTNPPSSRLGLGTSLNANRRFVPPTPAGAAGQEQRRFFSNQNTQPQQGANPGSSQPIGLLNVGNAGTGGQRMPFLPGGNRAHPGSSGPKLFKPR